MPQAEAAPDEESVEAAMAVLRRIHGDSIPQPTVSHVTRWASDPYSRGDPHQGLSRSSTVRNLITKP